MDKFAITGGIGSGKSFIAKMLREEGVQVYDCDMAAKRLMMHSEEVRQQLQTLVGNGLYAANGQIDKAVMREFLLSSEANRDKVNAIVHPAVAADFLVSGMKVMECAILYESGFDSLVDKVICVTAPIELRIQRVMQRDGIPRETVLAWMARQIPEEELLKRSDFLVYNDDKHDIKEQINILITLLK